MNLADESWKRADAFKQLTAERDALKQEVERLREAWISDRRETRKALLQAKTLIGDVTLEFACDPPELTPDSEASDEPSH